MKHKTSLYLKYLRLSWVGKNCPLELSLLWANMPQLDYVLSFYTAQVSWSYSKYIYICIYFYNRCFRQWARCKGDTFTSFLFQATVRCLSLNQPSLYTLFVGIIKEDSLPQVDFSSPSSSTPLALHYLQKTLRSDNGTAWATGNGGDSSHQNFNISKGMNTGCTDMKNKTFHGNSESQLTVVWLNRDMYCNVLNYISARDPLWKGWREIIES